MESVVHKPKISETFDRVRKLSFEEKKEPLYDETKVNKLLDKILEFKRIFIDKTNKINSLVVDIEGITWYTNVDNENLMKINDLISSIKDLHSSLLRQYISLNFMRTKGIAKVEIKNFKAGIGDLKDVARDLESTFFFLPNFPDFKETTKELSLL